MGVENIKRWQWALMGVAFGLLIAYMQIAMGADSLLPEKASGTISPLRFEQALREPALEGYPRLRNVTVYPPAGDLYRVKMELLVPLAASDPRRAKLRLEPYDERAYEYVPQVLNAKTPYAPAGEPGRTVHVRVDLEQKAIEFNHAGTMGPGPRAPMPSGPAFAGWIGAPRLAKDPGTKGAEVRLPLRRAAYQVNVKLANVVEGGAAGELSAELNGHPLAGLQPLSATLYRTTMGPAEFAAEGPQVLRLARKARDVPIKEITIVDPTYTVLDYLTTAQAGSSSIHFRSAWWATRNATLGLWAAGGLVLVGGVWPTFLNLLIGVGFGRPPKVKDDYDLSRSGGDAEPARAQAGVSVDPDATRELDAALDAKIGALEAELAARGTSGADRPAEETVKWLEAEPIAPVIAKGTAEDADFVGEFYPVARGHGNGKETKDH